MNYQFLSRIQLGLEYNLATSEIVPLLNAFLLTETATRPALFIGTSSDRIGSPAGAQAYYFTLAKRLPRLPLSVYGTVNYSEWEDGFNFPFGATVDFGRGLSVRGMYDGDRSHLMFNYFYRQHGVSLMYIWLERFGISMSTAF